MTSLWEKAMQSCNYLFDELYDDRTRNDWPNVITLITILLSYLYFCTKAGPAWMKNRKPFELKGVIFYYNVFQIIISTYLFYEGVNMMIFNFNWTCQPVLYEDTPFIRKMNNLTYIYMLLKLVELLDTIFFVLKKKARQISGLHLYHHFMMPICSFLGYKYYPNGHSVSLGVINCFVHMIMYTYYLISGMGTRYQRYLWWKKYVTILQLVQFAIIFCHNLIPLLNGCDYPKWINLSLVLCSLHFVYMFGNFYYVNYIKAPQLTANKTK